MLDLGGFLEGVARGRGGWVLAAGGGRGGGDSYLFVAEREF
jgi:hypothetical protein